MPRTTLGRSTERWDASYDHERELRRKIKAQREERSMKTAGTLRSADGSSKLVVESTGANNGVAAASAVPAKTQVDLEC